MKRGQSRNKSRSKPKPKDLVGCWVDSTVNKSGRTYYRLRQYQKGQPSKYICSIKPHEVDKLRRLCAEANKPAAKVATNLPEDPAPLVAFQLSSSIGSTAIVSVAINCGKERRVIPVRDIPIETSNLDKTCIQQAILTIPNLVHKGYSFRDGLLWVTLGSQSP